MVLGRSWRWGPPPRMRGRHRRCDCRGYRLGTTPAHAGKTRARACSTAAHPDHPRACGEDLTVDEVAHITGGPPPRMRGRRPSDRPQVRGTRTTPAHAGKTVARSRASSVVRDHPRACGEDGTRQTRGTKGKGPPPRMRGRLRRICLGWLPWRTTPAHAGKTPLAHCRSPFAWDHPRACGEDMSIIAR